MIESCFDNHLNVQHATDYMGTYLMYLWAINVIVIIDSESVSAGKNTSEEMPLRPAVSQVLQLRLLGQAPLRSSSAVSVLGDSRLG